jgi:hypothetical protein
MASIDLSAPSRSFDRSGESSRWIVLACYIATILLIYGAPGAVGAIGLTGLATTFWWVGFGRDESHFEPIAIGNAVGIFAGLAISFLQIGLPVLILVVVVLTAAYHRARLQRQPPVRLIPGALSLVISFAGAVILGQILPQLPI